MSSAVLPSLAAAKSNSSSFLCWVLSTAAKGKKIIYILLSFVRILLAHRCIKNTVIMVRKVKMFWFIIQKQLDYCYSHPYISNYRFQLLSGSNECMFSIQRSLSILLTIVQYPSQIIMNYFSMLKYYYLSALQK